MTRLTVTFDEDQHEWIEQTAKSHDRSKAWVVKEAVNSAMKGDDTLIDEMNIDASSIDAVLTDEGFDSLADLAERIADLEDRVDALEASSGDAKPIAASGSSGTRNTPDSDATPRDGETGAQSASTEKTTDTIREPGGDAGGTGPDGAVTSLEEDVDAADDVDDAVPVTVATAIDGWDPDTQVDTDRARAELRRALARMQDGGRYKKSDLADALVDDSPLGERSWWERAVQPGLRMLTDRGAVEYRPGHHDYRLVEDAGGVDVDVGSGTTREKENSEDVYDPTEEF
jgi:predicted transcriptional regulator